MDFSYGNVYYSTFVYIVVYGVMYISKFEGRSFDFHSRELIIFFSLLCNCNKTKRDVKVQKREKRNPIAPLIKEGKYFWIQMFSRMVIEPTTIVYSKVRAAPRWHIYKYLVSYCICINCFIFTQIYFITKLQGCCRC